MIRTRAILLAITAAVLMMTGVGCNIPISPVPTPPEGTYTPEQYVAHFKKQMQENEYRIKDWVQDGEQFSLRLPDIMVGDNTLTYRTEGRFMTLWRGLTVECTFTSTDPVRQISNGDTVDVVGKTTEAKLYWLNRIVLKMTNCEVSKVENDSQ